MRWRRIILCWGYVWIAGSLYGQKPASARVGPPPSAQAIVRVGIVADAQYCDRDATKGRYYRLSLEKLHAAVDTFNAQKVDFVINLGDLIDEKIKSYPMILREIGRLEMPVYHVLGNHEFWEVPYHLQKSIYDSLGLPSGYCDLELPSWRFLMLDGTELAVYSQGAHQALQAEGEACRNSLKGHTNSDIWNGAIGEEQLSWIEWQLEQAESFGEQVALFCHFPISPAGHPMTLWNEADLRSLLARYPHAKAWFAGHSHTGGYQFLDGIHHLTFGGMLMTPDSNAFAILDFFPDKIQVEGFGREPFRTLSLRKSDGLNQVIFPAKNTEADAVPEPTFPCIQRWVIDPNGRVILMEEFGGINTGTTPKLKPGCYEILENSNGQMKHRQHVVLPALDK